MFIASVILPVFLLILLGKILAIFRIVSKDFARQMMLYLFWVAGPAIIFETISSYHISNILVWKFWLAYVCSIVLIGLISVLLFRLFFKETFLFSLFSGFLATIKNTIIIGFPILAGIIGAKAVIPMTITAVFFCCFLSPFLVFLCEHNKSEIVNEKARIHHFVSSFLKSLKNPLVVAAIMGVIFSALHLSTPDTIKKALLFISPSFIPCALISVGVELSFINLSIKASKILSITILNLIAAPTMAILLALIFNLKPFYAVALVVLSSVPTAKSMYIYAKKYEYFEKETSAVISATTVISLITIPLFIYISYLFWPSAFHGLII